LLGFTSGAFFLVHGLFGQGDLSDRIIPALLGLILCVMAALVPLFWKRAVRDWEESVAEQIDVPESVTRDTPEGSTSNMPNAMRGREPPTGAEIVTSQPIGCARVMLLVVAAIGLGLLYFGWAIEGIIPEWPRWAGYIPMAIGALAFLAGIWPNNWRKRSIGFIATSEGVYVHGQGSNPDGHEVAVPETSWLFVPWSNVVDVREGLVFKGGGETGGHWWPSTKITCRLTPDEARAWFPHADSESSDDGNTRLVSLDYSESDLSPKETVPELQKLWERSRP
jgi:hypothetical protein